MITRWTGLGFLSPGRVLGDGGRTQEDSKLWAGLVWLNPAGQPVPRTLGARGSHGLGRAHATAARGVRIVRDLKTNTCLCHLEDISVNASCN